ncbi:lipopolysaccharide-induced tumor necrosis factor-alpha factor homolog isoform X2 [Chelonus insularis]|nr:lipopolysaccharide-induced tumor necrosis factor-alpha factor homolog isoform X2 [Chelonus insularis]
MEKGNAMCSRPLGPTAPPPSPSALPPSYEEAIAQSMGVTNPPISVPPYPTEPRIPMPTPYIQPMIQMPQPNHSDGPIVYDPSPQYNNNTPPTYPITSEVRVVRQPGSYALAPSPVKMQCPSCLADIKTSIVSDHQPMAHICCLILCILGCCLCSCLPYCMSAFMTVHHFCPRCKIYIGTWKGFEPSRRLMAVRV